MEMIESNCPSLQHRDGGFWLVESNENNDWVIGDGKRSKLAKDFIAARMRLLAWSIKSGNSFGFSCFSSHV